MEFGNILAELRQDRGMLQKDLAALLNVSVSTVSNYETGAHFPDIESLMRLADYFDISVDYLLGRTAYQGSFSSLNEKMAGILAPAELINSIQHFDKENMNSLIEYIKLLKLRR